MGLTIRPLLGNLLCNALAAVSINVLALPLPRKFSIRAKNEVQFVQLFKSSANCRTYMKYCSGICQTALLIFNIYLAN